MKKLELGGYYISDGIRKNITIYKNPNNISLLTVLDLVRHKKSGVVVLENMIAQDEVDPESLKLYFENGNYLLTLLDYDDEGYINVRTLYNKSAEKEGFQDILGEPYGATMIVQDFEVVKRCFVEFNERGNVSFELLN